MELGSGGGWRVEVGPDLVDGKEVCVCVCVCVLGGGGGS